MLAYYINGSRKYIFFFWGATAPKSYISSAHACNKYYLLKWQKKRKREEGMNNAD